MGNQNSIARSTDQGLSSFALKLVALVAMTCNHTAYIFQEQLPAPLACVLWSVGGLAFPLFAFLLVQGYRHTSDFRRYAMRLGVFALISQVPYWLFLGHVGNVLFTLLASLLALYALDHIQDGTARFTAVAALVALTALCDWGLLGPLLVIAMKQDDDSGRTPTRALAAIALILAAVALVDMWLHPEALLGPNGLGALGYALGCLATAPLTARYNGQRGPSLKWLFYAYYPLHIAVLGLVHMALFA